MHSLAVVPIFVNAGAALLPAIIAGLTSLLALLLSPRAMLNLCRRKPWLPVLILILIVGLYFSPRLFSSTANATNTANNKIDWPAIARNLLQENHSTLLTPLWQQNLDGEAALATPAIFTTADGKSTLYLPTTLFESAKQFGNLFAFDVTPPAAPGANGGGGRQLWKATTPTNSDFDTNYFKPFFSSPALSTDGTLLVVGQGLHEDANCPLLCFNLQGTSQGHPPTVVWSVGTPVHVESSPAVFTHHGLELAVVGAGAIEGNDRLAIGNPGYVFCTNIRTGKQLWQFSVNDPESSPAVDENGIIYIGSGFNGNAVVALRSDPDDALKNSPRLLWRTPTPHPATGDPLLASDSTLGNVVLIGIGNGDFVYSDPHPAGFILALSRDTGKILWQTSLPDSVPGRLALAQWSVAGGQWSEKSPPPPTDHRPLTTDHCVVLSGCRDGQAYALDLATGKILWHTAISTTPNIPVLAGLTADSTRAYALAVDGTLAVLSLDDGHPLERLQLSDPAKSPLNLCFSTPLIHDHILYVATETTGLHAFRVNP